MAITQPVRRRETLKARLDELVTTFDISTISPDPLELVLGYSDPNDQEVAGLLAAVFAYGRADIVVRNVGGVLAKMGASPYAYLVAFDDVRARRDFSGFVHRFHKTDDLVALLSRLAAVIRSHRTLGALFRECHVAARGDVAGAMAAFSNAIIDAVPVRPKQRAALRYLLSSPEDGSACKRMNLYLRWMVRREAPDLGLWSFVSPSQLIMPLDTHVHRISSFLGLTKRRSADWKTASELTAQLAKFDRDDPVRYDFAICRLGILDLCSRKRRKENCDVCLLREVCRFPVL